MNLVVGSSWSPLQFPSSSLCSQSSVFLYARNAETKRRNRVSTMASLRQDDFDENVSNKRRAVLLVGISVLPFLKLRATALEGLVTNPRTNSRSKLGPPPNPTISGNQETRGILPEESVLNAPVESQKSELPLQRDPPSNPFLSLLNALGIFGTAVLAPLYALTQKDKKASVATIESMKNRLSEKEASILSLKKEFESKLQKEQEERTKLLKTAKEEQQVLMNQLNSANSTITGLGQELKNEKKLIEELKVQIDSLQSSLLKAGEDKSAVEEKLKEKLDSIEALQDRVNLLSLELQDKNDSVQQFRSSLAEKEMELKNLNSIYKQTKDELVKAEAEVKGLRDELLKNKKELELRSTLVDELNATVSSLIVETDDSKRKIDDVQKEYDDLKLSSEKKAAFEAKLLGETEEELHELKEKHELAQNEVRGSQTTIAKLTQEKDDLKKMLDVELSNVENLKRELATTQETLGKTRNEASDLENQLVQSTNLCSGLESEISRVKADFAEIRETFQKSLDEAKQSSEVLASELTASKELLKKTSEELQIVTHQLAAATENRNSLQKELVDIYKKAEATANDLKEEKNVVASLNNELQALEKQILKDKEARKSLEIDLEEATKSLDDMNRNVLTLSRDLDNANSHISSLKDEKEVLYKSLTEQKNVAQEARENMEDAHNLVMRLGQERDSLDKKAKKLEEELGSAKGEVLRLRSKINSSKLLVNDQHPQKSEEENNFPDTTKRTGRRRKDGSTNSDDEDNDTNTAKRTGRRRKDDLSNSDDEDNVTVAAKRTGRRRKASSE
ncbi:hypothetical protein Pint_29887 [Pistacia integerrima]|uniref:Uncharacterized protein n=1 Tax=Pistacia integerrima TaxID=434235 RepID=A0ACC0X064_9ROSI|nr:hypothetical protein Pint_29887 [Pistacia integerrima]